MTESRSPTRSAGEGPPNLLCLHGWAGSGRYFDATIQQLDLTRVRAVTFDLRGHGRSDPAGEGYTLDRIAADALAVADAAGLDEFVVLGYSMGAKFGQYLALVAPERVRGLFLLAGCPTGEIPLPAELTEDWLGREGDAGRMAEIAEMYSSNAIEPQLFCLPPRPLRSTMETSQWNIRLISTMCTHTHTHNSKKERKKEKKKQW